MYLSAYYHDAMIWLPEVQFGINPLCSSCHCNDRIGVQGRVIVTKPTVGELSL